MERPGKHLVQKDHRTLRMNAEFFLTEYIHLKSRACKYIHNGHYQELLAVSLSRKVLVLKISAAAQAHVHFYVVTCSV